MKTTIRNIIALVLGLVVGGVVNIGLIMLGPALLPPPPGVDVTSTESIATSIHLFEPRHFVVPFLAHALGTFAGALVAYLLAASHRFTFAIVVGVFFLFGGITNAFMIPAPTWFIIVDLVGAYVPMAVIALLLGRRIVGR
jgi:hypothetical protein